MLQVEEREKKTASVYIIIMLQVEGREKKIESCVYMLQVEEREGGGEEED